MKIVIDIDEHIYEQIMADSEVYVLDNEVDRILIENAIYAGTPLPEGHGDLIDRSKIGKAIPAEEDNCTGSGMTYDEMDFYNEGINSMWDKLQNADPIIKADTRRDEG